MIPTEQIIAAYEQTQSVWKAGELLGMSGQTVHTRLSKTGVLKRMRVLTDREKALIEGVYKSGIIRGDGKLQALSKQIGRTIPFISRYAGEAGLTSYSRQCTAEINKTMGERQKKWIAENGHPRGATGIKFSEEALSKISAASKAFWGSVTEEYKSDVALRAQKTKRANGGVNVRKNVSWKGGWAEIGGKRHYFRSAWERNYARWLQFRKENLKEITDWEFEPKTFWFEQIKRGTRSYLPDFRITRLDGTQYYDEVKGWMDDRSKTKLKRMKKYYPSETVNIIDKKWFQQHIFLIGKLEGWEK